VTEGMSPHFCHKQAGKWVHCPHMRAHFERAFPHFVWAFSLVFSRSDTSVFEGAAASPVFPSPCSFQILRHVLW
jgi:hypothetical protein